MDDLDDCPPPLEAIADGTDDSEELPPLEMLDSDEPPALGGTSTPNAATYETPSDASEADKEEKENEPTMQELMMAEGNKARQAKQDRQAEERKKMDKSFGEGMNLKEAFKKKPKKKNANRD